MTWAIQLIIALAIFAAGAAGGIKWHAGQDAIAAQIASEALRTDQKQQRNFGNEAATIHAQALANINTKLGDAREKIALLSDRQCLDAGTVGMLNAIGSEPVRATAGQSEGAAGAPASGGGLRFATERDTAAAIAICRARYAEAVSLVNQIMDIEDARHPPGK